MTMTSAATLRKKIKDIKERPIFMARDEMPNPLLLLSWFFLIPLWIYKKARLWYLRRLLSQLEK